MTLELRRVDLDKTNEQELIEVIKDNCDIAATMKNKMEVLKRPKNKMSSTTPQEKTAAEQEDYLQPVEESVTQDPLTPYIEAFNSYTQDAKPEYLHLTEQTIGESEYIRLLVLLQLQSARNLIELKEMITPDLGADDLAYLRDCVTEEQQTRELVSTILKTKETPKITRVIKREI